MRDAIAEHSTDKYVGWIMGSQWHSRETYQPSEPKCYPAMPAWFRVAVGKDGGDREGRNAVARGKTSGTSQHLAMSKEPCVAVIAVERNSVGEQAAIDVLDDGG